MRPRTGSRPAGNHALIPPRLLRADERTAQPWRNGAGLTRDVAVDRPGDAFGWRVSIATIDRDTPFSAFPGYDRTLLQIAGGPLLLALPVRSVFLRPGEHVAFAGETAVMGRVGTTVTALNVMTDRNLFSHRIGRRTVRAGERFAATAVTILVALTNGLIVDGRHIAALDAILMKTGASCMLHGDGVVAAIHIDRNS